MEQRATLIDYWLALYQRKYTVLAVVISACAFAYVISISLPPLYEAHTTFYVPANATAITFTGSAFSEQVAQKPLMPLPEEKASAASLGILTSRRIMEALHDAFPMRRLDQLRKNVDVTVGRDYLIEVYVRDADPVIATKVANRLPQLYQRFHQEILAGRIRKIVHALSKQYADIGRRLDRQSNVLRSVQVSTGVLSPNLSADRTSRLVSDLQSQLDSTNTDLAATRESLKTLETQLQKERALYRKGELVLTSPRLEQLQTRLGDLNAKMATIQEDPYNPSLPTREAEVKAELKETSNSIKQEIQRLMTSHTKLAGSVYEKLRQDIIDRTVKLSSLQASRTALIGSLAKLRKSMNTLPATMRRIEDLKSSIASLQTLQQDVGSHLVEARMQAQNLPRTIVRVEAATVPERPVFPKPLLNTAVAGLVGLVVGCYYVLLLNYLSRLRRYRLEREMDRSPLENVSLPSVQALLDDWKVRLLGHSDGDGNGRTGLYRISGRVWEISERRTPDGHIISRRRLVPPTGTEQIVLDGQSEGYQVVQEDAYIVYDRDGHIVEMSANYPALYPDIADLIKPGTSLQELLRAAAERGHISEAQGRTEEWALQKAHGRLHPEKEE